MLMRLPTKTADAFSLAWEQRKLGEISRSFEYGLNAAATTYDGKNRYVRITDIDDETRLFSTADLTSPDIDLKSAENYRLQEGDIVFARTGASVGKTYIYKPSDGIMYYAGFLIRARIQPEYSADFVFQNTLTEQYRKFVAITSQRSGQPGINAQEYSTFEFSVPSYAEQQQIGAFFRHLDHLITLHQRKYSRLCNVKKSMLERMFLKDGASVPEIRFAGFADAWEQRKLTDFAEFFSGLTYTPADVRTSGTLVLRSSNVSNGEIVDADNVFVDGTVVNSENVQEGDIIIVVRNGSRALIGKHAQIKRFMPNTVIGAFMAGLRTQCPEFANALLNTRRFDEEVSKNMGATINQITGYMFSKMEFFIPGHEEQKRIGTFFCHLDHLITLHQRELERLQNIKKSCLEKMFV